MRFRCARDRHADRRVRGEPIAPLAGARTAEAIVPAIEADDRYPGRRMPGCFRRRGIEMSPKDSSV